MRHARARGVLGLALVAALAATIVAAPMASAKKATPARTSLVKAVGTASGQAKKLITASRRCPATARQRAITAKVRTAQTRRLAKASAISLRLRQFRISVHTRRLAVALAKCSTGTAGPQPAGPGTRVLQPTPSNGSNGADGSQSAQLPLEAVGDMLDVAGLLDGGILPSTIPVVDIASLGVDPSCVVAGTACVGVDSAALTTALTDTVRQRVQGLPVLAPVLDPLLAQVQASLASAGVGSLLTVERTGDSSLAVTARPGSALAGLLNVLGATGALPSTPIATVQVR